MKKITELEQRLSKPDSDKFNELESKIEELEEELDDNDERLLRAGENIKAMDKIRKQLVNTNKQECLARKEAKENFVRVAKEKQQLEEDLLQMTETNLVMKDRVKQLEEGLDEGGKFYSIIVHVSIHSCSFIGKR
jgi:DNA repair exonuclease SbcCD ATPase subunit